MCRTYPSSSDRETSAIVKCSFDDESFSDLFISRPRWSKSLAIRRLLGACLLRSTKMTTLGYFRNWRTNGHERWEGNMYVMKEKIFVLDNFSRFVSRKMWFPNVARDKILLVVPVGEIAEIWRNLEARWRENFRMKSEDRRGPGGWFWRMSQSRTKFRRESPKGNNNSNAVWHWCPDTWTSSPRYHSIPHSISPRLSVEETKKSNRVV